MQLIFSRSVPFIDTQSLEAGQAREVLFRDDNSFVLYLTGGAPSSTAEERVISLGLREALIWLNETAQDCGSFWD
jgi:hypothetical protein